MSLVYFSDLFSVVFLELYVFNVEFRKEYSQMLGKGKKIDLYYLYIWNKHIGWVRQYLIWDSKYKFWIYLIGKNLKKNKEESSNVAVQDPKGAAMAQLGLNLNKTTRNLRKEDIDVAFIQKMHDSEYS